MAFGFIRKVFSFGKDKVEETPPAAGTPVEPKAAEAPAVAAEAPAAARPVDPEPPAAQPSPAAEIAPPLREPSPIHADPLRDELAPEIDPVPAPVAPAEPVAPPEPAPAGDAAPDVRPAVDTDNPPATTAGAPAEASEPVSSVAAPAAEIAPPLRTPPPVAADPFAAEIAPEPAPSPTAPPAGRITVGKAVERREEALAPVAAAPVKQTWFQKLRDGLSRSSRELSGSIAGVFTKRKLDEDTLQDLEDVLIRADLGMETAMRVTDALASGRYGRDVSDLEVRTIMAQEVEKVLKPVARPLELDLSVKPHVILVVGVNGTGKTTTIGKLAAKLTAGGLNVMLAAGDTFRAAAIEQLKIWGERTGSPVVATKLGADAAGLAWDAFEKAKAAGSDVLIIDTAGRLQNKTELMAELEKIVRVLNKLDPDAPHTVLQTVDATTGQNALNQVEIFRNVAGVNGLVMTKLDGTARGGILVAIAAKHKLPVYFIGVGEQVDDLEPFSANDFAKAIAGVS
jgi:fused signal recognition particle receptor